MFHPGQGLNDTRNPKSEPRNMSAKAFVLVNVEPGVVSEIVTRLRDATHIKSAYMVTGPYDAIVEVEAEDYARIAEIVEEEVRKMEGIEKTMTLVVF